MLRTVAAVFFAALCWSVAAGQEPPVRAGEAPPKVLPPGPAPSAPVPAANVPATALPHELPHECEICEPPIANLCLPSKANGYYHSTWGQGVPYGYHYTGWDRGAPYGYWRTPWVVGPPEDCDHAGGPVAEGVMDMPTAPVAPAVPTPERLPAPRSEEPGNNGAPPK